jgi:homoserine kinase
MTDTVRIRVPATTANLGPGFDSLGLALRVYNITTVSRAPDFPSEPMPSAAAGAFFEAAGCEAFGFAWSIRGDVPRSRGMGSSVTVRLGILHGLNVLAGSPLAPDALYRLCSRLEGHPDNAAPAAFGGFTVARQDDSFQRFAVRGNLHFVLLIPDFEVETKNARGVLPTSIPLRDAVLSASNASAISAAFASRNYEALRGCFADGIHQPYRAPLVPGLSDVISAAEQAGALGGWLSGSGSTIACCTQNSPEAVSTAMSKAYGNGAHHLITTQADNQGVRILGRPLKLR